MAKTVYLGITGDIIHPGIINIINEGAKLSELTIGLLTDVVNNNRQRKICTGCCRYMSA